MLSKDPAYQAAYYQRNKERYRENHNRWRKANREAFNAIQNRAYHKRRARLLAAAAAAADPSTVAVLPTPPPPLPPPAPKSLLVVWGSFTS